MGRKISPRTLIFEFSKPSFEIISAKKPTLKAGLVKSQNHFCSSLWLGLGTVETKVMFD